MADSKISALPVAATLTGAELVPVVQNGISVRSTATAVAALVNSAYTAPGVGAVTRTVSAKLNESVSVKDFGAVGDGATDDSAAFLSAQQSNTTFFVSPATGYRTNTALTGTYSFIAQGNPTYSGSNPLLAWTPGFGGALQVASVGNRNALVGMMRNNLAASTTAFPTAVTAMGRNDNAGNTVFGLYAPAYQYASSGVTQGAEIDSFNMTVIGTSSLPPTRSIGTAQNVPVGLLLGAGGTFASSIALEISKEGSSPQQWLTGIYMDPNAIANYGLFIDASATGPTLASAVIKHKTGVNGVQIQGVGTPSVNSSAILYTDGNGVAQFSVKESGQLFFATGNTANTVGVAGAAAVLPTNPTGYVIVQVNGVTKKIPYYEP